MHLLALICLWTLFALALIRIAQSVIAKGSIGDLLVPVAFASAAVCALVWLG